MYASQKYIQKAFTTHSRNDFDFWNEIGEILLKINEKAKGNNIFRFHKFRYFELLKNACVGTIQHMAYIPKISEYNDIPYRTPPRGGGVSSRLRDLSQFGENPGI